MFYEIHTWWSTRNALHAALGTDHIGHQITFSFNIFGLYLGFIYFGTLFRWYIGVFNVQKLVLVKYFVMGFEIYWIWMKVRLQGLNESETSVFEWKWDFGRKWEYGSFSGYNVIRNALAKIRFNVIRNALATFLIRNALVIRCWERVSNFDFRITNWVLYDTFN